ncbi:hypothetical protein ACE7GA_01155 [Roseomonas sp. CCTCC AB2023176]|uniref:hypothetical protein n=1 Tax=Roseomonas sp. CCTCC AB2023176 TaxID=3342640 RepID=UPI0035D6CEB0
MPDSAHPLDAAAPRALGAQGLVDNFRDGRIFGWAWNPSDPAERVRVALRLDGEVVAEAVADGERADLRGAGIGDGRHAFVVAIPPGLIARRAEISVTARGEDGRETRLPIRAAPRPALAPVPPVGASPRAGDALAEGQAALREQVQALARSIPHDGAAAAADLAALAERTETLEAWCLRLDERLAALGQPAKSEVARRRGLDRWQITLGAVLFLIAAAALAVSWIGPGALLASVRG